VTGSLDAAVALHQRGQLREAAVAYVAWLRSHPDDPDAMRLLAMALLGLGHAAEALATLDRIPAPAGGAPGGGRRRCWRPTGGQALAALQRWDEAAAALRRAVDDDPGLADGWGLLADVEHARGAAEAAARAAARALVAEPVRARAVAFADRVAVLEAPPPGLRPALLAAYELDGVDHALLDRAALAAIPQGDPAAAARDPLTCAWLRRGSVPGFAEDGVVALRSWLAPRPHEAPEAVEAVALGAWAAEYVWEPAGEDLATTPAARAMFRPPPADDALPPALERRLREEPAREEALAAEVPTLALGDDELLRRMYEGNPYPRRVSVHVREPVALGTWLRATFPGRELPPTPDVVDLLVAGCGTGRHAIQSATTFASRVTALDLSRASLGRARRRAEELGVRIEWLQADLRELGGWERRFDVVESVGVLHHLPDWVAGLRVLRGLLRDGGLVRLGLYAEAARQDVVAARAFVRDHGFGDDPAGIRAARRALRALPPDHPAAPVTRSVDFGSVSGCRDLVFHVREHRVTLPELGQGLAATGLELLGFQHALPEASARYRARWPDDPTQVALERWGLLERDHPRLFAGMYVFWARAAGPVG
jgi:SAM-dependent methyltransferase